MTSLKSRLSLTPLKAVHNLLHPLLAAAALQHITMMYSPPWHLISPTHPLMAPSRIRTRMECSSKGTRQNLMSTASGACTLMSHLGFLISTTPSRIYPILPPSRLQMPRAGPGSWLLDFEPLVRSLAPKKDHMQALPTKPGTYL
jgi:hypothetical protein